MSATEIVAELERDRVLSQGQLERHHRCAVTALPKDVLRVSAYLAPTHHARSYREVHFVTLERKLARLPAASLRHLAGVAELRRLLGAPGETWFPVPATGFGSSRPDAVWESPKGLVAIEYDAGSYGLAKLLGKMTAFQRFERQVWGSPSRCRVAHLNGLLAEMAEGPTAIFAPWL